MLLDIAQGVGGVGGDGGEAGREVVVADFLEGALEGKVVKLGEAGCARAGGYGCVFLGERRGGGRLL